MSKKKKKETKKFDTINFEKSLKEIELMSNQAVAKLQEMVDDMLGAAQEVKKEYDLDIDALNDMSGSITQIHEDSPFLDEIFKGDSWKKVIKTDFPTPKPTKKEGNDDK
jgi:hypothetical protein